MIHSEGFLKLVNEAKGRIHEVTVDEVRARQQSKQNFEFVDVREDSEWDTGSGRGGDSPWKRDYRAVTLKRRSRKKIVKSCSIAEGATVRRWPPMLCSEWATRMFTRWRVG